MKRWALGVASALTLIAGITLMHAFPPQGGQDNSQDNPKPKLSREEKRRQKEEERRRKAPRSEFVNTYWKWLHEEVPYIITDQERFAFMRLATDDEREQFIEGFWERRNPNPASPENVYKEAYYQRFVYANEQFGTGIPGWKTDRGRIYIMYGPPDEVDSHPHGESYERPEAEGGGRTILGPFEDWRYRFIEGIGNGIALRFADTNRDGEYHFSMDPGLKDALSHPPPGGMTFDQPPRNEVSPESMDGYTRLDLWTRICQPPAGKFRDLKALVRSHLASTGDLKAVVTAPLSPHLLPFEVRPDYIRATDETTLTPITIEIANREVQFQNKDGVMHGVVDIYGEITSLGGRTVYTLEKGLVLDAPEEGFQEFQNRKSLFQEVIPLRPGRYKLSLVLKDELSGHVGFEELGMVVPNFSGDKLTYSSLILADQIMPLPNNRVVSSPFWIGGWKVRPNVSNAFTRDQRLRIYMQVYNLGIDERTHKPSLAVRYEVEKDGKLLLDQPEDDAKLKKASQLFTVARRLIDLQGLTPGKYTVQVKVIDNIKKQSVSPSASFEVR
jgi:GWxTD domain-containing protein